MGGAPDLYNLDMHVLAKAKTAGIGWSGVSAAYVRSGKEKVWLHDHPTQAQGTRWSTSWRTILEFLGAYRKLIVDHLITGYIETVQASQTARKDYAGFMGDARFEDVIRFAALGSTHATSDYDVTLCGPGAPCVVQHITRAFADLTGETMAFALDSNFYIGPDVLTKKGYTSRYTERGIKLFYPYGENGRYNVALPVPDDAAIIDTERAYITQKLTPTHVQGSASIMSQYAQLVAHGKELDAFAYMDSHTGRIQTRRDFFELMFNINRVSMEAYYGISSVLVVVYGMQSKMMDTVREVLPERCFENACLENALDFTNHWNQYAESSDRTGASDLTGASDQVMFVKLSKYIVRVLTCIDEIKRKTHDPGKLKVLHKLSARRAEVDAVYGRRNDDKRIGTAVELAPYGIGAGGRIVRLGTDIGLVHDVYRYVIKPASK